MPKLFIIRHAIAVDREDFTGPDDDVRPLTPEGKKKMKKISAFLHDTHPQIDLFIQSPLLRSQQTVEILKAGYKNAKVITSEHLRPNARFAPLCEELKSHQKKNVAIVGHEDHLSHFTCYLLTGKRTGTFLKYKKGGGALLEFMEDIKPGYGKLTWLFTPKLADV